MAQKAAFEPLSVLYVFPTFASRDDYLKATGQEPPAWNPNKRPKRWADPVPVDSGLEGADGTPQALYKGLDPATMATGAIKTKGFLVPLTDAATVNLPPTGPGSTNTPGADQPEVPVPLKDLAATQKLVRRTPFSGVEVQNMDVQDPVADTTPAALAQISAKLDKILAKFGIS